MTADPDIAQLVAEMRARAEAATPGEWFVEKGSKHRVPELDVVRSEKRCEEPFDWWPEVYVTPLHVGNSSETTRWPANAAHIAASCPANTLAILDAFDARGREIEQLTKERDEAIRHDALESMGLLQDLAARATRAESALAEARRMVETLADLIQCLVDNDPDEPISDNGFVVLDKWRHDAARALADIKEGARDG